MTLATVNTYAELIGLTDLVDRQDAIMAGFSAPGDGAGGVFTYVGGSAAAANKGTIVAPTVGGGRFLRILSGRRLDVTWFGAKGDPGNDTIDDTDDLTTAINEWKSNDEFQLLIPNRGLKYRFTSLPNLINPRGEIIGVGYPTLKHIGAGIALTLSDNQARPRQKLSGFIIEGNHLTTMGLLCSHVVDLIVEDIEVRNVNDTGFLLHTLNCFSLSRLQCNGSSYNFTQTTVPQVGLQLGMGISSAQQATSGRLVACKFDSTSSVGIQLENAVNCSLEGNITHSNGSVGLNGAVASFQNHISRHYGEGNVGTDCWLRGDSNLIMSNQGSLKLEGNRNKVINQQGKVTITSGAVDNDFDGVEHLAGGWTDNGTGTHCRRRSSIAYNSTTHRWDLVERFADA